MPLSFDPQSLMAPGGIAHGLDNLGSAVINALNRRAERRYASEAAAAKAASDESRFTRQLGHDASMQKAQADAAMAREKLQQTGATGRALAGEAGSTVRNFASNATDLLQTGMTTFGRMFSGKDSTSKDGLAAEKELNDTIIAITEQARKEYPDIKPNPMARMFSGDEAAYDKAIASQIAANERQREAFKLKRGGEHGLQYQGGKFSRAAAAPAQAPAAPAQAPAAPAPAAAAPAPAAAGGSMAERYRAKFPTSPKAKWDDARLEAELTKVGWKG